MSQIRGFDLQNAAKDALLGDAELAKSVLGSNSLATGFSASIANNGPGPLVTLGAGTIFASATLDATAQGSILVDGGAAQQAFAYPGGTVQINTAGTAGTAAYWLIQASLSTTDVVRPGDPTGGVPTFWNAANQQQGLFGQGNSGGALPTMRQSIATVTAKAGGFAIGGTETVPAPDAGCVPLYWVHASANSGVGTLGQPASSQILPWSLPQSTPGYRRMLVLTTGGSGTVFVPDYFTSVLKVRGWGGGGAGGNGGGGVGQGGGAGGHFEGYVAVAPLGSYVMTVGSGAATNATNGGATSLGSLATAYGGTSGGSGTSGSGPSGQVAGGTATGTFIGSGYTASGGVGYGGLITSSVVISGQGGFPPSGGQGGLPVLSGSVGLFNGAAGFPPGGGGGGAIGSGTGGAGSSGILIVEW